MLSPRSAIKAVVFAAAGYVAYRGVMSFIKNEITLSITEVVHLSADQGSREIDAQVSLKGEIMCETYLIRSYRLSMRLSANIKSGTLSFPLQVPSRHRIMHVKDIGTYSDVAPSPGSKRRDGLPDVLVDNVHSMVDYWELVTCGNVCFTPPCISEEFLLHYEGKVKPGFCASAVIQDCYLQPDEMPGCKRLDFDLAVYDKINAVTIRIELPNRRCRVVSANDSGLGGSTKFIAEGAHHWSWNIPNLDPEGMANRGNSPTSGEPDVSPVLWDEDCTAMEEPANAPTTSILQDTRPKCMHFVLVFEEQDGGDEGDASTNSDAMDQPDVDEEFDDLGAGCEVGDEGPTSHRTENVGRKAAKREERSKKGPAQRERVKSMRAVEHGSLACGVGVSLSYRVCGLASGMEVRRLRTVSERPNWELNSGVTHWFLRPVLNRLYKPRLAKFAHYTTWFVQTGNVVSL